MDQNSAGRHSATTRKEGGRVEATLRFGSLDRQSLRNGLRSWQISTYVGKTVNATGPKSIYWRAEAPDIWYSRFGRSMPLAAITS
jgi:hypothetical protein